MKNISISTGFRKPKIVAREMSGRWQLFGMLYFIINLEFF
jgi:hypothetical protein